MVDPVAQCALNAARNHVLGSGCMWIVWMRGCNSEFTEFTCCVHVYSDTQYYLRRKSLKNKTMCKCVFEVSNSAIVHSSATILFKS